MEVSSLICSSYTGAWMFFCSHKVKTKCFGSQKCVLL